jgi:CheY-like chemotaxis protein/predicted regulator of Ras-like GTPase activity (Roadblock/LC7/MglB family)
MQNVLIVDDNSTVLALLKKQFKKYCEFFTPLYACNGKDAVTILQQQEVSLLVTDLIMPGDLDGWALIEHIEKKHHNIPCVVMTSLEDKEKLEQLQDKVRHIFFKPIKVKQLAQIIMNLLEENAARGNLNGISVVSFLQLLEMDRKTCLVEIASSKKDKGLIYFNEGVLYDAVYGKLDGREAAYRLIGMKNAYLKIKNLPKKKISKRIKSGLMCVILEAMRLKDENNSDTEEQQNKNHEGEFISQPKEKENIIMALETTLETLRSINGYKASALMNFTGEILASDSIDDNVDLANVGAVFNDIFRASHEASGKVGLQACSELAIKTPDGLIIMACSGVDSPVHFHLISIMDADGNQALAKMQLDKMVPVFMAELS